MRINELNKLLGKCYNSKDFSELKDNVKGNLVYEAYDCMYRIEGIDEVINVMNSSIKENTCAYKGYYRYKTALVYHLKEVVLICDAKTLKCIEVLRVTKKRRKIILIEGLEAKGFAVTRGEIIN